MEIVPTTAAEPLLLTARLRLVAADPQLGAALAAFHDRNRAHLAPWDPPSTEDFYTEATQTQRLRESADAFAAGTGFRYLLQPIGDATRVIGTLNFSNVVRGAFQSCSLGYALDQPFEGQALMTEALRCAIAEMFSARVNLHRIQAAYRPENWRSAEVLKRLGFQDEGLAPDYLFIDDQWRVHRIHGAVEQAASCQPTGRGVKGGRLKTTPWIVRASAPIPDDAAHEPVHGRDRVRRPRLPAARRTHALRCPPAVRLNGLKRPSTMALRRAAISCLRPWPARRR